MSKELVVNRCHGGFSLSNKGLKAWADKKGIPCYFFRNEDLFSRNYVPATDEEALADKQLFSRFYAFSIPDISTLTAGKEWDEMTMEERAEHNKRWSEVSLHSRDIPRDCKDLVAVVKELGKEANGACASLEVVEIPDDVEWQIEEYDGAEHVAEVHRTW